uniref:Uncharacterized protein n=1 Tax=Ditylenchus dipsaci TaxID=166011 RepID=A0A915CX13_9BILA
MPDPNSCPGNWKKFYADFRGASRFPFNDRKIKEKFPHTFIYAGFDEEQAVFYQNLLQMQILNTNAALETLGEPSIPRDICFEFVDTNNQGHEHLYLLSEYIKW